MTPRAAKMAGTDRYESGDLTHKLCVRSELCVTEAAHEPVAFEIDEQLGRAVDGDLKDGRDVEGGRTEREPDVERENGPVGVR